MDTTHVVAESAARSEYEQAGWRARGMPLLMVGAGVGAALLLHVRDPHVEGSYGVCPLYALTGWWCPGCGGLRAVHNLTDGNIVDSLHSNVLAVPLVLAFVLWVGDWMMRAWRGLPMRVPWVSRTTMWACLALLTVYAVLRNMPWGTWLTPV